MQTRVTAATRGVTSVHTAEPVLTPASMITVGAPSPEQAIQSRRPPTSMSLPSGAAAGAESALSDAASSEGGDEPAAAPGGADGPPGGAEPAHAATMSKSVRSRQAQ